MSQDACAHHYVLPSTGAEIIGVCKKCGHEKVHLNWSDATSSLSMAHQKRMAARRRGKAIVITPPSNYLHVYEASSKPGRKKAGDL